MNFKKIINTLSPAQIRLARAIEKAGLASFTQACKAIFDKDPVVDYWVQQLKPSKKLLAGLARVNSRPTRRGGFTAPSAECG